MDCAAQWATYRVSVLLHSRHLQDQLKQQGMRVSRLHLVPLMRTMASTDRGGESGRRRYGIAGTCRLIDVDPHAFDINAVNRRLATIRL